VAKLADRTHYCHVRYRERDQPYVTDVVVNVIGLSMGYFIRNTTYLQYLLSCRLPGIEPVPSHVSIVSDRCVQSSIYLPASGQYERNPT